MIMYFGAQKYHDGKKVSVPYIFSALVSNMFTKVLFNERLPREKLDVLYEYDICVLLRRPMFTNT